MINEQPSIIPHQSFTINLFSRKTMKQVGHLMRKLLPPTASFIYNQITHYRQFVPHAVYCEAVASVFSEQLQATYPTYCPLRGQIEQRWYRYSRQLTPAAQRRLIHYLRTTQVDLLHVHYGVDALVYADMFRAIRRPVLVSFYGYDCTSFPNRFGGWGKKWLQRKLFANPHVSAYTAMSPDMQEDLVRLGCPEHKIIVHYHGSDPHPFFRERTYLEREEIHLLIISSLTAKKGHTFLLDAFRRAQGMTTRSLHLHIVGEGELRERLAQHISDHAIAQAYLHGPIAYGSEEHHRFLDQADIFVHPSVTTAQGEKEGIPGALIEARSSGLPVITTRHAGIPYIVEDSETGVLVPEYDIEALAQAIVRLANSATLRTKIGKSGQEYTRERLDVVQKEKELERIYQTLIEQKSNQSEVVS